MAEKPVQETVVIEEVKDAGDGHAWLKYEGCMSILVHDQSVRAGDLVKITLVATYGSMVAKVEVQRGKNWSNVPLADLK